MTKINLRAYNRQIGELITRGAYDEAIAHCRHILEVFPKHVETYRLLGRAYLEVQRYQEAADIFQRVLAAVPDDFVAHFALSKVREQAGDRKAALWHMERAFEVQPSAPAVQDELRRLYEAVEGLAPPRLRLTRGALARMYLRNGLSAQAVAELRSALADEPQRADLMALLAEALYQNGQAVEAANMAASLLRKLPYCLQANRLMARVLEETGRAEEAKPYLQRLYALDPYEAYRSPARPTVEMVPDEAVQLEQLDWMPEMAAATAWEEAPSEEPPLASVEEAEALPSWFGEPEGLEESMQEEEPPALESAELPEWLQAMAPQVETAPPAERGDAEEEEVIEAEIDEDFAALLGGVGASASEGDEQGVEAASLPDWLAGVGEEPGPEGGEAVAATEDLSLPEWLSDAGEPSTAASEGAPEPDAEESAPSWLAGLGEEGAGEAESAGEEEELPEWLAGAAAEEAPAADVEAPGLSAAEAPAERAPESEDDALAWLESLAAKHGAAEEELLTAPEARAEQPPEWVAEMAAGEAEAPETPAAAEETVTEEEVPSWLAGLGEEGAGETESAGEEEELPEWLAEAAAEEAPAAEAPHAETPAPAAPSSSAEDVTEWLAGLEASEEAAAEGSEGATPQPWPEASTAEESAAGWVPEAALQPAVQPPVTESAPPAPEKAPPAPAPKSSSGRARGAEWLETARAALASGDIAAAVKQYTRLIRRKYYLDEVIADLEEALVRYPVEVDLLQALGDAYMRADRLREALEAYNKAEALLR